MITRLSKIVEWTETMISKLDNFLCKYLSRFPIAAPYGSTVRVIEK